MRPTTFAEFWPYYLAEHLHPKNRLLHFIGTSLVYVIAIVAALSSWSLLAFAPLAGYGFAWAGHFFVEKNRPATFTHPLWSLVGDFKMHALMLTGGLGPHLYAAQSLKAQGRSLAAGQPA
jgi:hypothetical protein